MSMHAKYKVGYISGMFDILHIGHIEILRRSKEFCDHLIVAVGTDEFMMSRKNRASVMPYHERIEIVKAIRYVDQTVPGIDLDKLGAYHRYKFDVMFAGDDHKDEPIYIQSVIELKKLGVDTMYFPRFYDVSSSGLRKKISLNVNT